MTLVDKSIRKIAGIIQSNYLFLDTAGKKGLFQRLDPRLKVIFLIYFIVIVSVLKSIYSELAVTVIVFMLVCLSRLNIFFLYKRMIALAFFFGFLVALPSLFNAITPGEVILPVATMSVPRQFWIYTVPRVIGITREGCFGAAMLSLRVLNSLGISLLVVYTTPFFELVRALKVLRIPETFLMILILSYKYIFILSRTAEDMYLAMKSRLAVKINSETARTLIAGRIFFIFNTARMRYEETFKAMQGRGFSGEIKFATFRHFTWLDLSVGLLSAVAGIAIMIV